MGRGKLKMTLMEKKKSRMLTFKKRKEGLTKKLQELTTLCDVRGCMIIYDPDQETTSIWPPPELPHELIDAYKRDSAAGKVKFHGVSDYFAEKRREVEEEGKNLKPVWEEWLSLMSESELRDFGDALQSKANFVRSRIKFLKLQKYCATDFTPLFQFQFQDMINPATATATATATGFDMVDYNSSAAAVNVTDFYAPPQYPYMPCSSSFSSMENLGGDQSLNYWPLNACDDITHYISFE